LSLLKLTGFNLLPAPDSGIIARLLHLFLPILYQQSFSEEKDSVYNAVFSLITILVAARLICVLDCKRHGNRLVECLLSDHFYLKGSDKETFLLIGYIPAFINPSEVALFCGNRIA
jgi:hypothetical protein